MARKGRSRRKAGGPSMEGDSDDENAADRPDFLSDTHTIASFATSEGTFDSGDFDVFGGDEDDADANLDAALLGVGNTNQSNAEAAAQVRLEKLSEALGPLLDIPSEKRSARREGYLKKLFRALTQYATGYEGSNLVESRLEELMTACKYSLRAGSPAEQYAACRVLEATAVVLGADSPNFWESIHKFLGVMLKSAQKATPVRVSALRAMAMAVFIGCSDDSHEVEQLLDLCEAAAQPKWRNVDNPASLRAAALDCWTLLATTLEELYISGRDDVSVGRGLVLLPLLQEALEQQASPQLRSAAGECMAFIHETRLALGVLGEDVDAVDANATARKFAQGSWEGSEWEDVVSEIQQLIASLAVESTHHLSKKLKKELRATFREFQATVVDDEPPEHTVAFRGGTIELNSWKEIVQLNFIRHCLQGGFQIQLLTNPTLHIIFGANAQLLNSAGGYSQLQKRLILSKGSEAAKEKDLEMTKNRRKRENVKNHFLTVDGEDI